MRKDYDLVGSYDNQRVSTINAERTVNLFEYMDENGKRPKVLLPTSGLVDANLNLHGELGGARASFVFKNAIYNVYGQSVFKTTGTSTALVTTLIGTLTTAVGFVGIDANTFQVIFVDGEDGYIWDVNTNIFVKITDTSFPALPIDVCFLDGFFVVASGGTNNFQLSMINQGLVWGPDFTTGVGNAFTATSGGSPNLVLTTGTTANYQIGSPIIFTIGAGGVLPVGTPTIVAGTTYFVKSVVNATTFTISATDGGTAITFATVGTAIITLSNGGQLQLGSITSHPGNIVGCRTLHRILFLFSENYTEVWENAGRGTNLPFRRNNSLLMEVGTPALGSIVVGFDRMFFLAQDKDGLAGVMEVKGSQSIPASNRALDFQLAQYAGNPLTGVADARGVLVKENGIIFYRLNFTKANHTFVLNVTMSMEKPQWHEEEVLNGDRHPAQTHAYFDGLNFYGDYKRPLFYIVDNDVSTNNGETIRRMRIGRQMCPEGYNRLRIDRFQVDLLQGSPASLELGDIDLDTEFSEILLTEAGEDIILEQQVIVVGPQPTVFLAISKDGGQTYGNYFHATMGKIGERTHRTVWRKLGTTPRGQGFIPKIEFFNTIPFIVLGAAWDFETLPE
jgi:hypothetical protein